MGLVLKGRWHKYQARKAEARAKTAEAKLEIQKVESEYAPKIDEVEQAGKEADAGRIADIINRRWGVRGDKAPSD
ncbi:MAG: hypothetical protein JRI66_13265 [Deltaproteobacteria bacterium]|nr:hypothetical protein [Deltaproteobacteria bacterium]